MTSVHALTLLHLHKYLSTKRKGNVVSKEMYMPRMTNIEHKFLLFTIYISFNLQTIEKDFYTTSLKDHQVYGTFSRHISHQWHGKKLK